MLKNVCFVYFFVLINLNTSWAIPAFPGAEGFGKNSVGGRGGIIYEVTTLADSGTGSLRAAVNTTGPRIIVFRVSGTIQLLSDLEISKPYITIAGQTAPGDGICIRDHNFKIKTHDVIIRYIRFRLGDESLQEEDAVTIISGYNIIFDHCSMSWSVDEVFSTDVSSDVLGDLTVQWCIISQSLNCSIHSKGCHGYGSLLRGCYNNGYSFHHNLYAHHAGRSPRPGNYVSYTTDPCGLILDFRNNVIYNWKGSYAGYNADTEPYSVTKINFVGNYYKRGINSTGNYAYSEESIFSKAHFSGNWMSGIGYPPNPFMLVKFSESFTASLKIAYMQTTPIPVEPVTTVDAETAYNIVLAAAGASFPIRDAVDEMVVNDVINGTGSIIDDEDQAGGWPILQSVLPPVDSDHDGMPDEWELAACLDPFNPNDRNDDRNNDGYTNIEEYLNWLPTGAPMPVRTDLNCDGIVNFHDLSEFAEHWNVIYDEPLYGPKYDFCDDDIISFDDLLYIVQDWLTAGQEY